ncbi:MAG: GTP-binding protein, partial [Candidatus Lokiarchaeota archaeon]|nr:GTP-binding protein [Candidatus Lokiarchaeota archaeon]MBD3341080.1 GTP-binding protein [Candidatus Lokiarchaeota archaeon]
VLVCGLSGAGKSTFLSFLKEKTFIEKNPTLGKEVFDFDIQGFKIEFFDMGGLKEYRSLWKAELHDVDLLIFIVDSTDEGKLNEAKIELSNLAGSSEDTSFLVLLNKVDRENALSTEEIIERLDLKQNKKYDFIRISSRTGFGLFKAFNRIFRILTGKGLQKNIKAKAFTIYDKGGVPLTTKEGKYDSKEVLSGGLLSAMTTFVKQSFHSDLNTVKMKDYIIIIQKTNHLMGSLIIEDVEKPIVKEAEENLRLLLQHLEKLCPELKKDKLNPQKIEDLVQDYYENIL